jgi:hypothetical protein
MSLFLTKVAYGVSAPAAAQIMNDDVSDWAMQNGYDDMNDVYFDFMDALVYDPEFIKMAEEASGEGNPDPYSAAMQTWSAIRVREEMDPDNEYGWSGSLVPYSISSTEWGASSTGKQAAPRPSTQGYAFLTDEENGYPSYPKDLRSASLFLAPREGDFDFNTYNYQRRVLDLRVKKDTTALGGEIARSEVMARKKNASYRYRVLFDALDIDDPNYTRNKQILAAEKKEEWEANGFSGDPTNAYAFQDVAINVDDVRESYVDVKRLLDWKLSPEGGGMIKFVKDSNEDLMMRAISVYEKGNMLLEQYPNDTLAKARVRRDRDKVLADITGDNAVVKHFIDATMLL